MNKLENEMDLKIDKLGRIFLPKVVRTEMNIDESSCLSITLFEDCLVIRKRHSIEEINKMLYKIEEYIKSLNASDTNISNYLQTLNVLKINLTKKED